MRLVAGLGLASLILWLNGVDLAQAQQSFVLGSAPLSKGGKFAPRVTCPSPNPNLEGPPNFMDGCPLPASGLNLTAPINSPSFTGIPTAPTPPTGDSSSRIATTAFVQSTPASTVPASGITGTTLPSNIVGSSITTLGAGAALGNIGTLSNAEFIGYGGGSGIGNAQAVLFAAGSGASFSCVAGTPQVCTIGATGTGGVSGPSSSTVSYVPQWGTTSGNALLSGLPVVSTPMASAIVETGTGGTIANGFLASGAALANIGLAGITASYLAGGAALVNIGAGNITSGYLASGAAASNVGSLGGSLTGMLPSPSLASGAALGNIGTGNITASYLAPGAAASNIGTLSSDLSGTLPGGKVVGLQGFPVASTTPLTGQIEEWSGSAWTPSNAPVSGINALTQDVTASGTGSQPATVVGLQGNPVSSATPIAGQYLGWSGSSWGPTNGGIMSLTQDVIAAGTGAQPATVVGLQGRPVSSAAPATQQLLGWNGSAWAPANNPPATGVTPGNYTVATTSSSYFCQTINASGQITSMVSGECSTSGAPIGDSTGALGDASGQLGG